MEIPDIQGSGIPEMCREPVSLSWSPHSPWCAHLQLPRLCPSVGLPQSVVCSASVTSPVSAELMAYISRTGCAQSGHCSPSGLFRWLQITCASTHACTHTFAHACMAHTRQASVSAASIHPSLFASGSSEYGEGRGEAWGDMTLRFPLQAFLT